MTSSPPSVESADDLAKRMRRWAEDAPIAQRSELRVVMKAWADEVEADRKAREDHDRAERAELAKQLWAALRPQDGIPFYTISREKFDSIVSKLEADSQPKQEREA